MLRRIVVLRGQAELAAGWRSRSFEAAGVGLEKAAVGGMRFDESAYPIGLAGRTSRSAERPLAAGFDYGARLGTANFAVAAEFEDVEAVARFARDRGDLVAGTFANPRIQTFGRPYCGNAAIGDAREVAKKLGVDALRERSLSGKGARIAIVDTGVDSDIVPVSGGWSPRPDYRPGSHRLIVGDDLDHGTMCAFDARIAAPQARILDYALLRGAQSGLETFLFDAVAAFADLRELLAREPGPLIVNNSWGMYDRSDDAPIGSPENYSANLEHPFNQIVADLVDSGADVFFAAGNCGEDCPSSRCGGGDIGPGRSIHGANSHPDVVTVAAATVADRRLGYSAQGPGGLHARKPDIAAFSHFAGSGAYDVDSGTSAACPVAAGVAAALRSKGKGKKLAPAQMKALLQRTARDIGGNGWDADLGYGILDAKAAAKALEV